MKYCPYQLHSGFSFRTCKNWVSFQEVENCLNGIVHEDTGDMSCTEHDPAHVLNYDAATQCEPIVLLDAETQCQKLLKRSIGIQMSIMNE